MVERSFCCFIRYWYYIMVDFNLLLSLQPMMFSTIESPGINAFCFFLKVKLALFSFLFSDGDVMLVLLLLFLSWDDDVTLVLLLFYLFCDNDVMLVLRLLFNMLWWRNVDVNIFVFILWWRCSVDWDIFFFRLMGFGLCCCKIEFPGMLINFCSFWCCLTNTSFYIFIFSPLKNWFHFWVTQFDFLSWL